LTGSLQADAAVLGAGFTGLAAARRLAELKPGWRIALLDALRAGEGASGRSSGFVVDRAHFIARLAGSTSRSYLALCRRGIADLRHQVTAHAIPCDWDERGWLHAAAGEEGARELPGLRAWLDDLEEPYEQLDRDGLAAVTGTPFYRAGLRLPGSVLVQPAALARGLAAALPANVDLFEESPVRRLDRTPAGGFHLSTPQGSLATPLLLVAANGYSPSLGLLSDRLFPLLTFGSLTRTLAEDERAAIAGESTWGLLAEDPMGSTLRRTRDGRLLVRNTVRFTRRLAAGEELRRTARELHRRALLARYPQLRHLDFEWTWGGVMGASPNRGHSFGEVEPGLLTAAGYTGAGIALGTAAGALLADLALGERSSALEAMLALPEPARLPPRPLQDLGIRWRVARLNASAGPWL